MIKSNCFIFIGFFKDQISFLFLENSFRFVHQTFSTIFFDEIFSVYLFRPQIFPRMIPKITLTKLCARSGRLYRLSYFYFLLFALDPSYDPRHPPQEGVSWILRFSLKNIAKSEKCRSLVRVFILVRFR